MGTNKMNEIILIFQYFYSSSMSGQKTIDKIFYEKSINQDGGNNEAT